MEKPIKMQVFSDLQIILFKIFSKQAVLWIKRRLFKIYYKISNKDDLKTQ